MKVVKNIGTAVTGERFAKQYAAIIMVGYALLIASSPAEAQSLRQAGESIFNTIYQLVGVLGAIAILGAALNWKFGNLLGLQDPKKGFINACFGTGLAFGVVGIVQFIKGVVSTGGGISGV